MPVTLDTHAKEKSTYIITANFTDEKGDPVVPDSIAWTLTDTAGVIINNREDEGMTPAAEVDVVLSGDDLQILSGEANQGMRTLTVKAIYDSDLGNNLPLNKSVRFIVDNLLMIS